MLRRIAILLETILLYLPLLVIWGNIAYAHASLVRSAPPANAILETSPSELRLWFSEPPEPRFSAVALLDRAGRRVEAVGTPGTDPADKTLLVASLQPLPPGAYTVVWRVSSTVDGHVTGGSFTFKIGTDQTSGAGSKPDSQKGAINGANGPSASDVANRWLGYLALAVLCGGFAFFGLVLRPALGQAAGQGRGGATRQAVLRAEAEAGMFSPALLVMFVAAWGLSILTLVVGAILQASASAGVGTLTALGSPLLTLLGSTRYGVLFQIRFLLLVLIGGLIASGWWQARRERAISAWWWPAGLGLVSLVLLMVSLGSHATAGPEPALAVIADWLHLLAAGTWAGGLVALLLTLLLVRQMKGAMSWMALPRLVSHFSQMAIICVAILGATGVYRAATEVADWRNLVETAYGTALSIKLGLLVPILGLAAANLLLIRRRLGEAASTPEPDIAIQPWYRHVLRAVTGEVLLICAVLLATGALTGLQPGRGALGSGLTVRGQAADLQAVLVVSPGQPGANTFDLYLGDKAGRQVTDAQKVALIFTLADKDVGETEIVADDLGKGHFSAEGEYMAIAGTWHVEVLVRRQGRDDVRATLILQVPPQ